MTPATLATEGWVWTRCARRRIDEALVPASDPVKVTDRHADLAQGIEALHLALAYARQVTKAVEGSQLPGVDWPTVSNFMRFARNALVHGDERLTEDWLGYHLVMEDDGNIRAFGKPQGQDDFRTERLPLADLQAAVEALTARFDLESTL